MTATISYQVEVQPIEEIVLEATCLFYGITKAELENGKKNAESSYRRHMCIYLIKSNTFYGFSEIARMFKAHHSSIEFASNKIEDFKTYDRRVIKELKEIQLIIDNFKEQKLKWLIHNSN